MTFEGKSYTVPKTGSLQDKARKSPSTQTNPPRWTRLQIVDVGPEANDLLVFETILGQSRLKRIAVFDANKPHHVAPLLLQGMYQNKDDAERSFTYGSEHYDWFRTYILQEGYHRIPEELKLAGIRKNVDGTEEVQDLDLTDYHRMLLDVIEFVAKEHEFGVKDIVDVVLQRQRVLLSPHDRNEQFCQLIFACFGIVTLIFKSRLPRFKSGWLSIESSTDSNKHHALETWSRLEQPLSDGITPMLEVICKFGNTQGPIPFLPVSAAILPNLQTIVSCELNYYHLSRLGDIRIIWVDSICQHLEFNRREKSLMIFRYPSYCAMLSYGKEGGIFLDQLFADYYKERKTGLDRIQASDFLKEMLMTYRLMFGQDRRSRSLCKDLFRHKRPPNRLQRLWRSLWHLRIPDFVDPEVIKDPLLKRLCCQDCNEEKLYDDLYISDVRTLYSAQQDFPFFGQRLLTLQEHIRILQPHDIWTLWYDHRDLNRFYTVWALIVFSTITLLIALASLGLAAAQVGAAFRSPQLSPSTTQRIL